MKTKVHIRSAISQDIQVIFELIRALADFEKLSDQVVATEEKLRATLFPEASSTISPSRPAAEVLIAEVDSKPAGFALFFSSYSTFLAQPGIYLEDLFVKPEFRSQGTGRLILQALARLAVDRGCGRLEWSVLDWNKRAWDFYSALGAKPLEEWTVHRLTGPELKILAAKT